MREQRKHSRGAQRVRGGDGSIGERAATRGRDSEAAEKGFGFGWANYALLAGALVAIVAGYVLLDRGSVTAAPILLVLGYVVLIPAALLVGISGR